jgi:hypothetical protein
MKLYTVLPANNAFATRAKKVTLSIGDLDFDSTSIVVRRNYYDAHGTESAVYGIGLSDFLKLSRKQRAAYGDVCPDMPIPAEWAPAISFADKAPTSHGAFSLLHAGLSGAIAPLHFDWDFSWAVNAVIRGRKSFMFLPPSAGWMLAPVMNTSSYCVPRFSHADRAEWLSTLGGVEMTVEEGQAVCFPSIWWHAVTYSGPAVSVSVRFDEPIVLRPLRVLPRSWLLQRLVWSLWDKPRDESEKVVANCLNTFFAPAKTWLERYNKVTAEYRRWLERLSETKGVSYLSGENFSIEVALGGRGLAASYELEPAANAPVGNPREVSSFLFASGYRRLPKPVKVRLAALAIRRRQGLQPRRGLVAASRRHLRHEDV